MFLLIALPANAATETTTTIYPYIVVSPSTTGVTQPVFVSGFTADPPPSGTYFSDVTVTITDPEGVSTVKSFDKTDTLGAIYFQFTPTMVGTYTFQSHYPQQEDYGFNGFDFVNFINTTILAADSNVATLTVQQQPLTEPIAQTSLPTNYWTRPISGDNHLWSEISSNWLMGSYDYISRSFDTAFANQLYGTAPNRAHILWTRPYDGSFGGLVGGEYGDMPYYSGISYQNYFKPPVIINGYLYYNTPFANQAGSGATGAVGYTNQNGAVCVDMATGETVWSNPNLTISFGQVQSHINLNEGGAYAYLWSQKGTTWSMYDAVTGKYILSIADVPSGIIMLNNPPSGIGEILVYSLDASSGTLTLWNSTLAIDNVPYKAGNMHWPALKFYGQTLNASDGIQWTKVLDDFPQSGYLVQVNPETGVLVRNGTGTGSGGYSFPDVMTWCSYSITDGSKQWGPTTIDLASYIPPNSSAANMLGGTFFGSTSGAHSVGDNNILAAFIKGTLQTIAFDVQTGQKLWGPSNTLTNGFAVFNWQQIFTVDDFIYNCGYDGHLYAYDANTGSLVWDFYSGDAGTLTPYGTWPFYAGLTFADGKVYATTGMHGTGVATLYRGQALYAIDAMSGEQVWNMSGWFEQPAIADGKLVTKNNYNNEIYCFGQGPTQTTVTVPMPVITQGSAVLIQGTVTDQSPGAKGTPAICDEDMSAWMVYLYNQKELPTTAKGVQVKLTAIDPNGNWQDIGTATSDIHGNFAIDWTPPVPGMYQVTATFEGTNSYYSSSQTTYFTVSSPTSTAPAAVATPTTNPPQSTEEPTPPSVPVSASPSPSQVPQPTSAQPTTTYIAIAAAVVVIAVIVAAVLVLRRRK
ncbi:MAG: PQQ-binding-like beta-propeller repeat protein [Candidatus Bathyarchaeota archaeon]|nr:PQQ-binding-like beta-propeller repeat protein [Candidatus Bathyarchaeota archaeon]